MLLPWEIIMYEGFIINTLHWKIYTSGSQTVGKALYMDAHFERCLHPNERACCQSNRWWYKPDLIEMLDNMEPKKTSRKHSLISKKMIRVYNFATARQNLEKKLRNVTFWKSSPWKKLPFSVPGSALDERSKCIEKAMFIKIPVYVWIV